MQLLEQGGVDALTTNAVAARAGVSIGSLYQYFRDKQALLDALAERELGAMSVNLLRAMNTPPKAAGDRIRGVVRAVLGSYGGRSQVHRRLVEHSLKQGGQNRLSPLLAQLQLGLMAEGAPAMNAPPAPAFPADAQPVRLTDAQAWVLTHAMAGVLRTLATSETAPPLRQVEEALVLLAASYVDAIRRSA